MNCVLIVVFLLVFSLFGCVTIRRLLVYNTPSIKDHHHFPNTTISGGNDYTIPHDPDFSLPDPSKWIFANKQNLTADNFIDQTNSACLIIFKDGKILYEKYADKYAPTDHLTVFSASKPILSFLLQSAIQDGFIKGEDQLVSDFLPFMNEMGGEELKIGHLLNMTSGLNHDEYGKIFQTLMTYYNTNLDKVIRKSKFEYRPGERFVYKSIDYQVLGRCIEVATNKSIEIYLHDKLWKEVGKYDLILTRDSRKGNERMFGGIAMVPMDFVVFGSMFLKSGLPKLAPGEDYIDGIRKRVIDNPWWGYKNGWWRDAYDLVDVKSDDDFFASGFGAQCMVVNPKLNTLILRLGTNKGGVVWHTSLSKLIYLINQETTRERKYISDGVYVSVNNRSRVFNVRKIKNGWRLRIDENDRKIRTVKLKAYDDTTIYNGMELDKIYVSADGKIYYDDGKTILEELVAQ